MDTPILSLNHSSTQFCMVKIMINLSPWQSQLPYSSHGLNHLMLFNGIFAIILDLGLRLTYSPYFILLVFFFLLIGNFAILKVKEAKRSHSVRGTMWSAWSNPVGIAPQEAQLHAWDENGEFDLNSGRILHGTWTFSVLWTFEIPTHNMA